MAEQVRFGGLRNMFHVIDFAVAQSFEHELAVVFEGDPIHRLSSSPVADRSRRRGRQTQRLFQPIHRRQNLSMKFRQGHPALAEMAIVFGQAADAGLVSHSQRADASPAGLTPGKHYRRMESPVWLGAMAGRVATARFETVDGAFDQLSMPENIGKLALILLAKIIQDLPLAAGKSGGSRGAILALHFTCCSHKAHRCTATLFIAGPVGKVQRKVNDAEIIFFESQNSSAPAIFMSCMDITEQTRTDARHKTTSALKIFRAADRAILPPTVNALACPRWEACQQVPPNYLRLLRLSRVRRNPSRLFLLSDSLHGVCPIRGFVGGLRCGVSTPSFRSGDPKRMRAVVLAWLHSGTV